MTRTIGYFVLGIISLGLMLEIAFRVLPVSSSTDTGYHVDPLILTYRPNHEFRMATGWDLRNALRHQANNFGFVTSKQFTANPKAVALIGDSYVEASMLQETDRLGPQLERLLIDRPVYALGGPGSNLLDYAERIRFASQQFQVTDFVLLLERGDVRQALCGSGNIHGPCLAPATLAARVEKRPATGTLKKIVRESAFAQYLFSQIKLEPTAIVTRIKQSLLAAPVTESKSQGPADVPLAMVDVIVGEFFDRIKPFAKGRLVLIFDCDRDQLKTTQSASDAVRDRFMALAAARGAIVIDTETMFREFTNRSGLSLDVAPGDKHWNAKANALAAQAAAGMLSK
jgi:hypothetical protein